MSVCVAKAPCAWTYSYAEITQRMATTQAVLVGDAHPTKLPAVSLLALFFVAIFFGIAFGFALAYFDSIPILFFAIAGYLDFQI